MRALSQWHQNHRYVSLQIILLFLEILKILFLNFKWIKDEACQNFQESIYL